MLRPRRSGGGLRRAASAFFRPEYLPRAAVRSARRRALDAACESGEQYDTTPGRGYGAHSRSPEDRALDALRRLLGLDAVAGVRANSSDARARAGTTRGLSVSSMGDPLVLPGRRQPPVPRSLAGFYRADS